MPELLSNKKTNYMIRILFLLNIIFFNVSLKAQDIDQLLNQSPDSVIDFTTATFKSTRIVTGHSIERMPTGQLDVRISHRFGQFNQGSYDFWGLDQSNTHFSLEYGINNWVMVGVGRGTNHKMYDGFLKFSILRQSTGRRNMPVSVSYLTTMALTSEKLLLPGHVDFWMRSSYVNQLLIARKFGERFSFEINPTFIHRNMVKTELDPNDILAVGLGGRFKLSSRISLNGEYYYVIPPLHDFRSTKTHNSLSLGFDIETGGHVFQLLLTNSVDMIEKSFIAETDGTWSQGAIHLGFNISRVFSLK
jgi:hypothetical protein